MRSIGVLLIHSAPFAWTYDELQQAIHTCNGWSVNLVSFGGKDSIPPKDIRDTLLKLPDSQRFIALPGTYDVAYIAEAYLAMYFTVTFEYDPVVGYYREVGTPSTNKLMAWSEAFNVGTSEFSTHPPRPLTGVPI